MTHISRCRRLFGSLAGSKEVSGVVQRVAMEEKNGRKTTSVAVVWTVAGAPVAKTVALRNVKLPPAHAVQDQQQTNGAMASSLAPCPAAVLPQAALPVSQPSTAGSPSAGPSSAPAVAETHGYRWTQERVTSPVGGSLPRQMWSVRTLTGDHISEGGDAVGPGRTREAVDYFLAVFPADQLSRMVSLTCAELDALDEPGTSAGEVLKFVGLLVLTTRFEFGSRAGLWRTTSRSKYVPAPAFGARSGMPRARFDTLWRAMTWSKRTGAVGSTAEADRWSLVGDFVQSINTHRAAHVTPSERLCVDESISRWYGQGGQWIGHGLPMYVAIDRKPENGCELQTAACGRSGLLLQIHVRTTSDHHRATMQDDERGLLHGTVVMMRLVSPWAGTARLVCADSYFSSVEAALTLKAAGLRFIGVVKTATTRYPMAALASSELSSPGQSVSFVHREAQGTVDLMALVWVDRDRRYFISTTSTGVDGASLERVRWRQVDGAPQRVALSVPQPQVVETYYSTCAAVDRHNRCRQDELRLEHKLQTQDWSTRVNLTLLGFCVVDAWLLYAGAHGPVGRLEQSEFYVDLATQLIDNTYDAVGLRPRRVWEQQSVGQPPLVPVTGTGPHLTPTNKRKKKERNFCVQRDCSVCHVHRTTWVCSGCQAISSRGEVFVCGPHAGRECFAVHLREHHCTD